MLNNDNCPQDKARRQFPKECFPGTSYGLLIGAWEINSRVYNTFISSQYWEKTRHPRTEICLEGIVSLTSLLGNFSNPTLFHMIHPPKSLISGSLPLPVQSPPPALVPECPMGKWRCTMVDGDFYYLKMKKIKKNKDENKVRFYKT